MKTSRLRRRLLTSIFCVTSAFGMIQPGTTAAQPLDDFEQRGIRTGPFNIFSSMSLSVGYNDNVLAVPEGEPFLESDILTIISPSVRVESNTQRHDFFLSGSGQLGRYQELDSQDFDDATFTTGGTWELSRTLRVSGSASYINDHESADDPDRDVAGVFDSTEIDRYRLNLSLSKEWQRTFLRLQTALNRREFDDVSTPILGDLPDTGSLEPTGRVNVNEGRDRTTLPSSVRLGYTLDPNYSAFVTFEYQANRFDRPRRNATRLSQTAEFREDCIDVARGLLVPVLDFGRFLSSDDCNSAVGTTTGNPERDFRTFGVLVGTSVDFDRLVTGEFSIGVEQGRFDDPERDNRLGFSFSADLEWTLSPRSSLTFRGSRGLEPSGGGDGGTEETIVGLGYNFALSPQARLGVDFEYNRDSRVESERVDDDFEAGVSASYNVNRYVSVGTRYGYRQRFSSESNREFTRNTVFLTLVGRY